MRSKVLAGHRRLVRVEGLTTPLERAAHGVLAADREFRPVRRLLDAGFGTYETFVAVVYRRV